MTDFDTWMKLNNQILRHMTTTLNSKPEVYVEEEQKEEIKNTDDSSADSPTTENDMELSAEELKETKDEIIEENDLEKQTPEKEEEK